MRYAMLRATAMLMLYLGACAINAYSSVDRQGNLQKIKIIFQGGEATVTLYDNNLAREFFKRLPLEVEFEDFSHTEKIFYLSEKLETTGGENADELKGDFCYYAPWGNIAVFYNGYGHGRSLYVLGMLETGKNRLTAMRNNFKARIEASGTEN